MSKGLGSKIGIKFTDDLIGDVTGNESSLKVAGKEYKYVNGPLIDKEYTVDKVERYPVARLWQINGKVILDFEMYEDVAELWDGTYTQGQFLSGCNFYTTDPNTRTTKEIPVTGGNQYTFKPNNRMRIKWNNSAGSCIASYTGNSNGTPETLTAPIGATGVFFYYTNVNSNVGVSILGVKTVASYISPKIYATNAIQLTGDYRIRWLENKLINTNIIIEYTTGEIPWQWTEVVNGEVVNVDTNIWIRATLSTSDTSLTPTLHGLWLEDSSAPQDRILITMDWWGKFNNAEGALTVEYDATKGNLSGQGGAVESFIEVFTPEDLKQTPNPGIEETITASPTQIIADFLKVEYMEGHTIELEKITAAPVSVTVELLHTSVVNP